MIPKVFIDRNHGKMCVQRASSSGKYDLTGGVAWCASLCGTVADGDPTVERAVVDPIGRSGRVALPPVRDIGDGLDIMPSSDHPSFCGFRPSFIIPSDHCIYGDVGSFASTFHSDGCAHPSTSSGKGLQSVRLFLRCCSFGSESWKSFLCRPSAISSAIDGEVSA